MNKEAGSSTKRRPPPPMISTLRLVRIPGHKKRRVGRVQRVSEPCQCCPNARSGHRMFAGGSDYLYVVGGYNPDVSRHSTITDVWRFNCLTSEWELCQNTEGALPNCLASFSMVPTHRPGEALLYGGTGVPFGVRASNELNRVVMDGSGNFAVHKQVVVGGDGGGAELPRTYGQSMIYTREYNKELKVVEEVVYMLGGTSGHVYNMDVWQIRPSNTATATATAAEWKCTFLTSPDQWREQGRYRLEAIHHAGKLLCFGGASPEYIAPFNELLAFDLHKREFTHLKTQPDQHSGGFPDGRKCHAMIEDNGRVYIIGGCRDVEETSGRRCQIFDDVWCLTLASMSWTKMDTVLPIPVFFHSAAVSPEGRIFVFGGCTDPTSTRRTNELQSLWVRPPPLKHLALDSLIKHNPGLASAHKTVTGRAIVISDAEHLQSIYSSYSTMFSSD